MRFRALGRPAARQVLGQLVTHVTHVIHVAPASLRAIVVAVYGRAARHRSD